MAARSNTRSDSNIDDRSSGRVGRWGMGRGGGPSSDAVQPGQCRAIEIGEMLWSVSAIGDRQILRFFFAHGPLDHPEGWAEAELRESARPPGTSRPSSRLREVGFPAMDRRAARRVALGRALAFRPRITARCARASDRVTLRNARARARLLGMARDGELRVRAPAATRRPAARRMAARSRVGNVRPQRQLLEHAADEHRAAPRLGRAAATLGVAHRPRDHVSGEDGQCARGPPTAVPIGTGELR
jgi:hypothetical protein